MLARAAHGRRDLFVERALGPLVNPALENADLFGRQRLFIERHARDFAPAADDLDEQALGTLARHDGRPLVAAAAGERASVEPQARLLLVRTVAGRAALHQ